MKFTYDAYVEFIKLRSDFELRAFHDPLPQRDDKVLLLRHDIDLDLHSAVEMAQVEAEHGIRSTYFVLMTSPFFNVHSAEARDQIRTIVDLGHWIGLHYDANDPSSWPVSRLAGWLADISKASVRTISYHRPAPELFGSTKTWWPLRTTYHPAFVKDIEYCSDSRGEWTYGPPEDRPDGAMQLLTHPEWWGQADVTPRERLECLLEGRAVHEREEWLDINFGVTT